MKRIKYFITIITIVFIIVIIVLNYYNNRYVNFENCEISNVFSANKVLFENLKNEIKNTVDHDEYISFSMDSDKNLVLYSKFGESLNKYTISKKLHKNIFTFFNIFNPNNSSIVYKYNNIGVFEDVDFIFYIPSQKYDIHLVYSNNVNKSIEIIEKNFEYEKINDNWYFYYELYT